MRPGKAKLDLRADDLREMLKGEVRHPYITGQRLAQDKPAVEGNPSGSKKRTEPCAQGNPPYILTSM